MRYPNGNVKLAVWKYNLKDPRTIKSWRRRFGDYDTQIVFTVTV